MMNSIRRIAAAAIAGLMAIATAQAQESPLVGSWQATHPAGRDGPGFVSTTTYGPNGSFNFEMAIAPGPGAAGGILRTRGQYRMTGPGTVQVTYADSMLCGAGTGCMPAPAAYAPMPGSSMSFNFQFRGNSQIVAEDGTVLVRVR
jgi:hypothetical protein